MSFISATVITRNEAHNIERCLNSLIGVADEIIVVDSHSTDSTVEICQRYGALVTERAFSGFGSQRQFAASLVHGRYVLSIDADEMLDETLRRNLIEIKDKGFIHRMYSFTVVNYVCGRAMAHSGLEPRQEIRLFDRRYANWDLLDVGERLSYAPGINPEPVPGALLHYRCNTYEELEAKEMRHAALRAKLMAAAGIYASEPVCLLRAVASFFHSLVGHGAFLDGKQGFRIALTRMRATLVAFRTARKLTNKE